MTSHWRRTILSVWTFAVVLLVAPLAFAQQIYEETTYDSNGSVVLYRGPVYGPNPDPNELSALTYSWSYQYPTGYTLLTSETGPMGYAASYSYDASYNLVQASYYGGLVQENRTYDTAGRLAQISRTNGSETHTLQYSYPSTGVMRITDPRGKIIESRVDSFGRLVLEAGPADSAAALDQLIAQNKVRTFTYDSAGNRLSATDEMGATRAWSYDSAGRILTETDAIGLVTSHAYDSSGRRVSTTFSGTPGGLTSQDFYYDTAGRLEVSGRRIDSQTVVYEGYKYDAAGRITHVVGPASTYSETIGMIQATSNVLSQITYDALGRRITQSSIDGEVESWTYDARNNVLTETLQGSGTNTYKYDFSDRMTALVHRRGWTETMSYDVLGRAIQVVGPWHDANGNLVSDDADPAAVRTAQFGLANLETWSQVDALPAVSTTYDFNLPISVVQGGLTWTRQFDAAGRMLTETAPSGATRQHAYDAAGRRISSVVGPGTPDEMRTQYTLDPSGRRLAVTKFPTPGSSSNPIIETFSYDSSGRLSGGMLGDGSTWSRQYDLAGRGLSGGATGGLQTTRQFAPSGLPLSMSARGGATVLHGYDSSMRLSSVVEGGARTWAYAYDSFGRVSSVSYPDGTTRSYGRDSRGLVVSDTTQPAGYTRSMTYDGRGRLVGITDGSSSYTYVYDKYDRLLSRSDELARTLQFSFLGSGLMGTVTYPGGDQFTYSYDAFNRVSAIQRTQSGQTATVAQMQYDGVDRVNAWTHGNGFVESFNFDGLGRLMQSALSDSVGTLIERDVVSRDGLGRIVSIAYLNGDSESFTYDASGQLVSASRGGSIPYTATFGYDASGNLASETFNGATYSYVRNGLGELVSKTGPGGTWNYSYDASGRTIAIAGPSGVVNTAYNGLGLPVSVANSATGQTVLFGYDVLGRRRSKSVGPTTQAYVHDLGLNRIETYQTGVLVETALAAGDHRRMEAWTNSGGKSYFYGATDNVRRLVSVAGVTTGIYTYDPFGTVIAGVADPQNALEFLGLPIDSETGFHDNAARMYSAVDRQFGAPDPMRLSRVEGTYQRTHNDPVNFRDAAGLCEHGSMSLSATVEHSTSSAAMGGSIGMTSSDVTFDCSPKATIYVLWENSRIRPCWINRKADVDMACVMATSNCSASVTVTMGTPGEDVENANVPGYGSGTFHMDDIAQRAVSWHEDGHVAIIKAYLTRFWEKGKKSLGGADSMRLVHEYEQAVRQADDKWRQYWEPLSKAMAAGVKSLGAKGGAHDTFHANLTTSESQRGRDSQGRILVDQQQYSGGTEPTSHENSSAAMALQKGAEGQADKDSKKFDDFPCRCKHK